MNIHKLNSQFIFRFVNRYKCMFILYPYMMKLLQVKCQQKNFLFIESRFHRSPDCEERIHGYASPL